VARYLTGFGYCIDQFNAGQRKERLDAFIQTVIIEGPARACDSICRSSRWTSSIRPVQNGVRYGDPNGIRTLSRRMVPCGIRGSG